MSWNHKQQRLWGSLVFGGLVLICSGRIHAETLVVPGITVSERYDSNVYFIQSGQKLEDYVTTITPTVGILHKGELAVASFDGRLVSEVYAKNPGLNYVAPNATLNMNLDNLVKRLDERLKLTVQDSVIYTPRLPSFASPEFGNVISDTFVRGIQASRANSLTNVGKAVGVYDITSAAGVQATYSHQLLRFGTQFATPVGGGFFDTTVQTATVGPVLYLTASDQLNLDYQYQTTRFTQGPASGGYDMQGGVGTWKHQFRKDLALTLGAGEVIVMQTSHAEPIGSALLAWTTQDSTGSIGYSRNITPSFYIAGVPLKSDLYSATFTHRLSQEWSATATANYGYNKSLGGTTPVTFTSYGGGLTLSYLISRDLTVLGGYSYGHNDGHSGAAAYEFDRHQITLTLRMNWN